MTTNTQKVGEGASRLSRQRQSRVEGNPKQESGVASTDLGMRACVRS